MPKQLEERTKEYLARDINELAQQSEEVKTTF
jgi:hypothetical protein